MQRKLLALYAHPDDESFGVGGTLARYADQGVEVTLVCATRGEAGEISDPSLATPDSLATVREQELRCAVQKLGVSQLILLGYRDSGMDGSPDNAHPRAFMNASPTDVVPRLVEIIRQIRPDVVITFEPNGGYGHPDHKTIHRFGVAAFHAAADSTQYPDRGDAFQPQRLFFSSLTRSYFQRIVERMEALGIDPGDFGERVRAGKVGWSDEHVNTVIDVSAYVERKWAALHCHRTQFGPNNFFRKLPESEILQLMDREFFALAWPEPQPGLRLDDLFADLP
jgi:LmbE family N-acetylglucosaminyl deacetylase